MPLWNPQDLNFGANAQTNFLQSAPANSNNGVSTPNNNMGGLGFNMDTLRLGLGGVQTVGNLWNAFQAQQLARDQFDFTRGITETNMANQLQSYNTSLEDRIRSRVTQENGTTQQADDYLNRNRLQR